MRNLKKEKNESVMIFYGICEFILLLLFFLNKLMTFIFLSLFIYVFF
jgi:hypothetical protein